MYHPMLFDFRKRCRAKFILEGALAMKNNVYKVGMERR